MKFTLIEISLSFEEQNLSKGGWFGLRSNKREFITSNTYYVQNVIGTWKLVYKNMYILFKEQHMVYVHIFDTQILKLQRKQ
jgi:hypothetical protein